MSSDSPRLRRGFALLMALAAAGAAGCSDPAPFAGVWKMDCRDDWGVQIRPLDAGRYAVTFCGLSGCMAPGEWMPDTRIVGDPLYQVESATTLRISRKDTGFFTYQRCSSDPTWNASAPR